MRVEGSPLTDEPRERENDALKQTALPPAPGAPATGRLVRRPSVRAAFASFGHRNYRLWFMGQSASLVGTWMQTTAQGFLIFQLTHSPAYLGYIGFAAGAPLWLFTLYGGVISDRIPRRTLLLVTQTAMMLLAFAQAGLTFLRLVLPWHLIALAFATGVANAFDAPARMAFVAELVERDDLANAIALNSTMVNLATAIGPAVAGVIYALLGPGWCFTVNGLSFIAVIAALLAMRMKAQSPRTGAGDALAELRAGLRHVVANRTVGVLIATVAVVTVFASSFATLLPAWAVSILGGDSTTNGFLQSARGVGSLIGAIFIASLGRTRLKGKLLTLGSFLFPGLLLLWAFVRWLPLSLLVLVAAGWGMMMVLNMCNVLVQSHVPDALRGRVMSIYSLGFFGMMPVGALLFGAVAQWLGEPATVAGGALVSLAFAVWLWFSVPQVRAME